MISYDIPLEISSPVNSSSYSASPILLLNNEFRQDQYLYGFQFYGVKYTYHVHGSVTNLLGNNYTVCDTYQYKNGTARVPTTSTTSTSTSSTSTSSTTTSSAREP